MDDALVLEGLHKRFAGHIAVRELSLRVPRGTIYGLLGPNGAGKSTTIRMTLGILARDGGQVRVLGVDPLADRRVLRRVGYLPEERGLYKKMRVLEAMVFFAELKGVPRATAKAAAHRWLERLGLADWARQKVQALSKGMQQKVQFAITVLHRPALVFLDEPTSGLDPINQELLREVIEELRAEGTTVVLSTHNMEQAEELCSHVAILARGEKVLDGELAALKRAQRTGEVRVWLEDGAAPPWAAAGALVREAQAERDGAWTVRLTAPDAWPRFLAWLGEHGVPVRRVEQREPRLRELYVARVGAAQVAVRRPEEVA